MSSILAHGLASLAAYQALRRPAGLPAGPGGVALGAALGLLPDVDVLARIALPDYIAHRGPTHSLAFALGLSLLAALALSRGRPAALARAWAGLLAVCCAHPALDWLMGAGPGVPFWWPLSAGAHLSPVQLVPTAYYSGSVAGLLGLLNHTPTLRGMALELVIFLPLLALAVARPWLAGGAARLPAPDPPPAPLAVRLALAGCLLAASAAGVCLTTALY
jgi:membrane-bound metal-dependent hydrolase YbcI (DUF457 family)